MCCRENFIPVVNYLCNHPISDKGIRWNVNNQSTCWGGRRRFGQRPLYAGLIIISIKILIFFCPSNINKLICVRCRCEIKTRKMRQENKIVTKKTRWTWGAFYSTKNSKTLETAQMVRNFPGMLPKGSRTVKVWNAIDSTEYSRNSRSKVEWKETFRKFGYASRGCRLFLEIKDNADSSGFWSLPEIQSGSFGWIESAPEQRKTVLFTPR